MENQNEINNNSNIIRSAVLINTEVNSTNNNIITTNTPDENENEHEFELDNYIPMSYTTNVTNMDKIQELIDNKKIINTLRSIKTCNSINYDEIKLLPSLFLDMHEALKKSNENVLYLEENIKEKIQTEKKLKAKLKETEDENEKLRESLYTYKSKENEYKVENEKLRIENSNLSKNYEIAVSLQRKIDIVLNENKSLKRKNEEYKTKIGSYEEEIENLHKINTELENKNKKYKSMHGLLQNEICTIEEHIQDVKIFQQEIKKMRNETNKMRETIKELEDEKRRYKEDNLKYIIMIKAMKCELKENLHEKIEILKEIENINNKYHTTIDNKDNFKNAFSSAMQLYKKLTNDKNELSQLLTIQTKELANFEELKLNFKQLYKEYENIMKENSELRQQIQDKKYLDKEINKIKESLVEKTEKSNYYKDKFYIEMNLRRKIYNRYMLLRGNIQVMCRIRPFLSIELNNKKSLNEIVYSTNNDTIIVKDTSKSINSYEFDYVFDNKTIQEDVYAETAMLIQSMMTGRNICIIAYGQTNSGKTYTIDGPDIDNQGISLRAAKDLFELAQKDKQYSIIRITLTIVEIYKEHIFNLLDESMPILSIYENSNGIVVIKDLTPITISSLDEAIELFKLASNFRHISNNDYNNRSNRSHCIYTFNLKMVKKDGQIVRSALNIIDLAGSEGINQSKIKIIDELGKNDEIFANLSLYALCNMLNSISIKKSSISYQDSKLTHFLKDSIKDNYNILLLLHISPNIKDMEETISTLEFGSKIFKLCNNKER